MVLPAVGRISPTFSLLNQNGKKVFLKDYRGEQNVVLYFYPKAMTPGCKTQACGLRDTKRKLSRRQTVVLGFSTDPVSRLEKFRVKEKLNFDLLSDEDHKIAEKYGVWGLKKFMDREYMGVNRMTFIIDKDGKLKHIIEKVNTKTHHYDVLAVLSDLK
jgi:peroxiredoxin Q/BCP